MASIEFLWDGQEVVLDRENNGQFTLTCRQGIYLLPEGEISPNTSLPNSVLYLKKNYSTVEVLASNCITVKNRVRTPHSNGAKSGFFKPFKKRMCIDELNRSYV